MIPLKDDNPSSSLPVVTLLLIGLNLLVFVYEVTLPGPALKALIFEFGAIPSHFPHPGLPDSPGGGIPWFTLLTSMFLHGGFFHVAGNMLYLWIFGDNVEDAMGHLRFLAFYLLCGVAAAFFQIIALPSSPVPLVGASGAIAGVLGAYLLLYPAARIRTLVIFLFFVRVVPIPALLVLGSWFLIQILSAPASGGSGVAFFAHIGGFLTGMALMGIFRRRRRRSSA